MPMDGSRHHARAERIALSLTARAHACSHLDLVSPMPRRSSVIHRSQRPAPWLRRVGSAALFAFLAASCSAGAVRSASASHDPDAREWIELFDGKTLNGWTPKIARHDVGDNYANTFRVVDGTIQARYDGYGGTYNA